MKYFEDIIACIEKNLTKDIDVNELAKMANMSVYEFRRIFSFVTKISFSEYIRKRRLSNAAIELYEKKSSISDAAGKYGYDSPSAFSRAFKEFHGISPSEVMLGNHDFKALTKINTEIITTGGKDISYSILEKGAFTVSGFYGKSEMRDTECCDDVWNGFYDSGISEKLCSEKIYAAYKNGGDFVHCYIGTDEPFVGDIIEIPESKWACFKMYTTDDAYVNGFYKDILNQWFDSTGYEKNNDVPNVEVFPSNMDEEGFMWEIWIAIK